MRMSHCLLLVASILLTGVAAGAAEPDEPIVPEEVVNLLDDENSSGLYTWLKDSRYQDPRGVFTVREGMLHISGNGLGYIGTRNEYANYHVVLEFKWGERTWGLREHRTRDCGLLLHAVGPDGNYKDQQYDSQFPQSMFGGKSDGEYITSVEAQIIEGGVGDLILIQGKDAEGAPIPVSLTTELGGGPFWKKGGEKKVFSGNACVQWFDHDRQWKDVTGFRGKRDVESPHGQWTRMDVVCDGARVALHVNGVLVNEGLAVSPSAGRILIQSELAEVYIRRWELWPLGKGPAPKSLNSEPSPSTPAGKAASAKG